MREINPTPARYWVRKDESIGVSFGNPVEGYHEQFDFYGSEELASFVVEAVNAHASLTAERDRLREALDKLVNEYAMRGGDDDKLLPVEDQTPEMADAIKVLQAARSAE